MIVQICIISAAISSSFAANSDVLSRQATDECRDKLTKFDPDTNRCSDFVSCCENLCGARRSKSDCTYKRPNRRDQAPYVANCDCGPLNSVDETCVARANRASGPGKDQCAKFVDCCQSTCKGNNKHRVDCSVRNKVINIPRSQCVCGAASIFARGGLTFFALALLKFL